MLEAACPDRIDRTISSMRARSHESRPELIMHDQRRVCPGGLLGSNDDSRERTHERNALTLKGIVYT